jgi:hypothetical protein
MGKKVIIVPPPQAVSVNVSVNVGQQVPQQWVPQGQIPQQQQVAPPAPPTQVNTAVTVGASPWPAAAVQPRGPYVPPFQMPTSDVLRRTIPGLARQHGLGLGDHVHTAECLDRGCDLLSAAVPHKTSVRPWAMIGWVLVALLVWSVQYSLLVPLVWLGAVAQSTLAKALGWFAILLCGLGPFYALFYLFSPAVPRQALTPWGLSASQSVAAR